MAKTANGTANGHVSTSKPTDNPVRFNSGHEGPVCGWDNIWPLVQDVCGWNPVCGATMTFKGKMTKEKIVAAFERRQKHFPRFAMRLTNRHNVFSPPSWEEAPRFEPEDHVEVVRLSEGADRHALDKLMGNLLAREWDFSRPMWQSILVENYSDDEGAESALLTRWHHVLADGQGFCLADLFMTDHGEELVARMEKGAAKRQAYRSSRLLPSHIYRRLEPLDGVFLNSAVHFVTYPIVLLLYIIVMAPTFLSKLVWTGIVWFHVGWYWFMTWWRIRMIAPQPADGPGRVKGKEFACSHRIPLSDVKIVQKAFGRASIDAETKHYQSSADNPHHCTVNHIFVSIMSEVATDQLSLRVEEQGPPALGRRLDSYFPQNISVFIPMSLRENGDWTTGNIVTGAIAFLPQAPAPTEDQSDPTDERSLEQLHHHVHNTKKELKLLTASWVPRMVHDLIARIGSMPGLMPYKMLQLTPFPAVGDIGAVLMVWAMRSLHGILTNIPIAAKDPVKVEGIEIVSWSVCPPQGEYGTLGLGVVSYASGVVLTVCSDKVPGREGFARTMCDAMENRFATYLEHAKAVLAKDKAE